MQDGHDVGHSPQTRSFAQRVIAAFNLEHIPDYVAHDKVRGASPLPTV